jgi:hypothetical protein
MKKVLAALILGVMAVTVSGAGALTIDEVQTAPGPDYESPYADQWVDVTGGIVTKVFVGGRTKIIVQDPTLGDTWAGIQVVFDEHELAAGIVRGDQIDLANVEVYESRGNTQLGVDSTSAVTIISSGNTVSPIIVPVSHIADPINAELSEKYEFMLLTVANVTVGAMGLGSHDDNYELSNSDGLCWASDYANYDLPPGGDYYVEAGDFFDSVTGYLEQYTKVEDGWDYYQLLPRDADDYVYGGSATSVPTWGGIKSMYK